MNGALELLVSGASDESIAQHLIQIAPDRMGLGGAGFSVPQTISALRAIPLTSE
jgi:hypothetical protein